MNRVARRLTRERVAVVAAMTNGIRRVLNPSCLFEARARSGKSQFDESVCEGSGRREPSPEVRITTFHRFRGMV